MPFDARLDLDVVLAADCRILGRRQLQRNAFRRVRRNNCGGDGISAGVGYATVYDYAITPEPGSLALLAAGVGALSFRRRQ